MLDKLGLDRWDHPVAILLYLLSGAVIGAGFMKEWYVPYAQHRLQFEADEARRGEAKARAELTEAKATLSQAEGQLATASRTIRELQQAHLFTHTNPYPVGLGQVQAGDSLVLVERTYPKEAIDTSEDTHWSVVTGHIVFPTVAYYFRYDSKDKVKRISRVMFYLDRQTFDDDFLQQRLVETLGQPQSIGKKGNYKWVLRSGV